MSSKLDVAHEQKEDRITLFPDEILCHILSLLPSNDAVRAGVLSTRWRNLWVSVANLDVDDNFLSRIRDKNKRKQQEIEKSFHNFVTMMINRDNIPCVPRLRLCCLLVKGSLFSPWVNSAITRGIKDLELHFEGPQVVLPAMLFKSTTLVVLRLETEYLAIPASVWLPNLKILHLNVLKYKNDWDLDVLLSSCPAIEDLVIKRWVAEEKNLVFKISMPTLKSFHMEFLDGSLGKWGNQVDLKYKRHWRGRNLVQPYKLVINAPSLKYLQLKDYQTKEFSVTNLGSLVEAYVDWQPMYGELNWQSFRGTSETQSSLCGQVFVLLKGITAVKSLSLSCHSIISLNNALNFEMPAFNNLKKLELDVAGDFGCHSLTRFLPSAPNLEILILIDKGDVDEVDVVEDWEPPDHVPDCLLLHLKEIKVKCCLQEDFVFEFEAVEYLLVHSKVLNKLTVECEYTAGSEQLADINAFFEKLTKVPRGSPTCDVTMVSKSCK